MKFTKLGKTGMHVSQVSLGTWQLGGGWGRPFDRSKAKEILHAALDCGVNFFDTADVYDSQQSERAVGKLVKENRHELMIATKIGRRISPHNADNYTPEVLEKHVDEALFNTGLNELDLVQLHCPPTAVYSNPAIFDRLKEIQQKGKVKHFGVSVELTSEAIKASEYDVVDTVQIIFNMFRFKPLDECFPLLKSKNIGVLARVPLASGLLSGKINENSQFRAEDHRQFNRHGEQFDKGETFSGIDFQKGLQAVEEIKKVVGNADLLAQYALRWVLMHEAVSTVIPGASRAEQVYSNTASLALPALSRDQMAAVSHIYDKYFRKDVHGMW